MLFAMKRKVLNARDNSLEIIEVRPFDIRAIMGIGTAPGEMKVLLFEIVLKDAERSLDVYVGSDGRMELSKPILPVGHECLLVQTFRHNRNDLSLVRF